MTGLQNKKVLVTGAGGFIGSHLAEELVRQGANVRAFVHYNALGSSGWLDHSPYRNDIEVVKGDIRDRDMVLEAMTGEEIVFHLAALIAIPYSYHAPLSYIQTNIEGTLNVLQAARQVGVERVLHTSTSEVYGTACYVPIDEKHPLQGQSPYSASKIGADKMAEAFHLSFNVPVVTVRPFNTFGPRQSARAIIPTIIAQCLSGDEVRLGKLTPTRDLNYVENTVNGFILAAQAKGIEGRTFNLGTGVEISIGDLAQKISEMAGAKIHVDFEAQRLRPAGSEVERLVANNEQAVSALQWAPKVSLDEGLSRTIEWFRQNLDRYRAKEYNI